MNGHEATARDDGTDGTTNVDDGTDAADGVESPSVGTTVHAGDFAFNPVEPTDFRLSVEGASGSGKSNTLAVLLEDLASVQVPTLIIERIGVLTPVRTEDEDLIVVGARDEEGVDIPVPLDQVGVVGEMVLDRGLKVLLDVKSYEGLEDDKHTEHAATWRAIKAINDRAHELFRSGDRRKCLLAVDEAHYLAPETNAPHPNRDSYVKRATGEIIEAATEGGNKGINIILAFQRRSYLRKGVLTQCDNHIVHQLSGDDATTAADATGLDADAIRDLDTGEILATGSLTDRTTVGPTRVRRRASPDPREERFELPDPPEELSTALDEVRATVDERAQAERERQDELEAARDEIERLETKLANRSEAHETTSQLLRELQRYNDLIEAGEIDGDVEADQLVGSEMVELDVGGSLSSADAPDPDGTRAVPADVVESFRDLRENWDALESRLEAAEEERDRLRERTDDLEETLADREARIAELEGVERVMDEVVDDARSILSTVGAEVPDLPDREDGSEPDRRTAHLEREVEELREENRRLRARGDDESATEDGSAVGTDDYADFLSDPTVKEAVEEAKAASNASARYVQGVIASIVESEGAVTYDEVATRLDVTTTNHVSSAATTLEEFNIVRKDSSGGEVRVDLNTEGIADIKREAERRERTAEIMNDL